jgi:N-acetylmuramoyl-L-alanine amidase
MPPYGVCGLEVKMMMRTVFLAVLLIVSGYNTLNDILFSDEHDFELRARRERERVLSSEGISRRIRRIVIDPGHGGFDPGAVNKRLGLREKEITLQVALKLKRYIEENSDIKVFLTRTGDYYVTLSDRTVTANQYHADLFLSIHCNSHENASAQGFESFFCSKEPSDREAARVAALENAPGLDDPFFKEDNSIDIESILRNLQRHMFLKESRRIAESIEEGIGRGVRIRRRGVKSADFFVLRHARMPAVLVELAFLSNPREARLLTDERFQDAVVKAIGDACGIRSYYR